ncbi:MAG: CDP-alcohol phosphatidyltransferase family protein [Elusimicrobia bacterium]|nr:CDP-alcohol phosphatidyltransferase family protein [Elusimicrobiota bacterium]
MTIYYKAYEIEEKLDLYFFHPLGAVIAHIANAVPLRPNHLTYTSMVLGISGAVMVYWPSLALWGVVMMVVSSIFDSADGQLARMQKTGTLKGRVLDGVTGYLTFITIHLVVCARYLETHPFPGILVIFVLCVLSGVSHSLQACLYDFFRSQYVSYVIRRRLPQEKAPTEELTGFLAWAYQDYTRRQRRMTWMRSALETSLGKLYPSGELSSEVAQAYRRWNRLLVKGWNLMGDNLRFLYLTAAILIGGLEWYFYFAIVPLNLIAGVLLLLQSRSDRNLQKEIEHVVGY